MEHRRRSRMEPELSVLLEPVPVLLRELPLPLHEVLFQTLGVLGIVQFLQVVEVQPEVLILRPPS